MPETIRLGSLEIRFLGDKHDTEGSLDLFEMDVPPEGRMPVPHITATGTRRSTACGRVEVILGAH
jgi:hypothetical protein